MNLVDVAALVDAVEDEVVGAAALATVVDGEEVTAADVEVRLTFQCRCASPNY